MAAILMGCCIVDQVQICLNSRITTSKFNIAAVTDSFYSSFAPTSVKFKLKVCGIFEALLGFCLIYYIYL